MAQLTWREMQAPDLSTSLRGYQQFSSLLDSALGKAQGTVDRINTSMDERANNGALRIAAAIQDPEQAKQILLDPRFMNDRLDGRTIAQLATRPTQITAQQAGELAFSDAKLASQQGKAEDALGADLTRAYALREAEGAGQLTAEGRAEYKAIRDRIAAAAGGVGSKNALSNLTTLSNAETDALGRATSRLNMDNTRLNMSNVEQTMRFAAQEQGWKAEDRVDLANASNAVRDVLQNARDPDTARNILSRYKLSGKAYSLAVSQLGGQFKGLVGDAPISGDPALAGIGDQGFTGPGLNGDYRSFMSKLENASGNPNAKNGNSSASGLYQFTDGAWLGTIKKANSSWARGKSDSELIALKSNPRYQDMVEQAFRADNAQMLANGGYAASNINLYGMHHFGGVNGMKFAGASGNTPMTQILTQAQINANPHLRNMTKDQAIQYWGTKTGGAVSTGSLSGATDAALTGIAGRRSQNNVTSNQRDWVAGLNDTRDVEQVIQDLKKDTFKGVSDDYIRRQILEGMSKNPGANAAQVGGVLRRSVGSGDNGFWGFGWARSGIDAVMPDWFKTPKAPNLGNGRRIDYTKRDAGLAEVRSGDVIDNVLADKALGDTAAVVEAQRKIFNDADVAYRTAVSSRDSRVRNSLPALERARNIAAANLHMTLGAIATDGNSRYQTPPVATTAGNPNRSNPRRIINSRFQ